MVRFSSPLTMPTHEKIAVAGHFYNCPNGHTFVIGDVRPALLDSDA